MALKVTFLIYHLSIGTGAFDLFETQFVARKPTSLVEELTACREKLVAVREELKIANQKLKGTEVFFMFS